jgi:fermentation-respiration switch protein FrsA (DUF1100 family)
MRGGETWLVTLMAVGVAAGATEPPQPPLAPREFLSQLLRDPNGDFAKVARTTLGKTGGNALFYFPTADIAETPATWGYKFENVWFPSADGARLHGWFLPSRGARVKGTVVFSHGNAGALGHHLGFVSWLLPAGYNVLMYDYRGFGSSSGTISRRGLIDDVKAAFEYVKTRRDVMPDRLVSFGHSLGGAKSIVALGEKPVPGLRAVISDAGFASYRGMAEAMAGNVGLSVVTDENAPKDWIAKIAPVPLLLIHGTADEVVPFAQGRQLFDAAREPKTLFAVAEGRHGDALWRNRGEYRRKMLTWLDERMK